MRQTECAMACKVKGGLDLLPDDIETKCAPITSIDVMNGVVIYGWLLYMAIYCFTYLDEYSNLRDKAISLYNLIMEKLQTM